MKRFFILLFLLIFFIGFSQKREFKNQGEQENYWAEQIFEKKYKKENYSRFNSEILVKSNSEILFDNKTLIVYCSSDYLPIFTLGIFYPQLLIGTGENNEIFSKDEFDKLTDEKKFFYNLQKNDSFNISNLEELKFLNKNPTIKRFRFWNFRSGFANPQVYYFELTNKNANKKTSLEEFIKRSELTYIKSGHLVI